MSAKSFFLLFLVGIMLSGCTPVATSSVTQTPIQAADSPTELPIQEVEVLVETEIVREPTQEPAVAAIPDNIILWFQALEGIADLNGNELFEGELIVGDVLSTNAASFVEISVLGDDRVLFELKPNSEIKVETATPDAIRLYLDTGVIRSTVGDNTNLSVTIAADAGESQADGTVWISEVDQTGALLIAVLEGRVVARAPGGYEVEVLEGERLDIPVGSMPGWPESTIFIYFHSSFLSAVDDSWDSSQPATLTGRYSRMYSELISAGYIVEDSVNPEPLGAYDVLITVDAAYGLTDENMRAIQTWVENGKGLFIAFDWATGHFNDHSNQLLEPFGIQMRGYSTEPPNDRDTQVALVNPGHPVTDSVANLALYKFCQLDGGIPLAQIDSGETVMAAYENGGKVLVLCDTDLFANIAWKNHPEYDQSSFILNAIKWLASEE